MKRNIYLKTNLITKSADSITKIINERYIMFSYI